MKPPQREVIVYKIAAHPIQQAIMNAIAGTRMESKSLRDIAKLIKMPDAAPQKIKHHIGMLVRYGFVDIVGGVYKIGKELGEK